MKSAHVMQVMTIGHGAKMKKSGVAISFPDPFHFTCNGFQCLIPRDPGKFTDTSFPRPLKRIKETVGSVNPLSVGAASQASPRPCTVIIVIVLDSYDPPPLDMHFQFAKAAAVAVADRSDDLFSLILAWVHIPNLLF
jgi:hypothetical protein